MARLPRLEIPGLPHLLIQRGHNDQPVFVDDDDRRAFRDELRQASRDAGVALHAYALGSCDLLMLATPDSSGALGRMMQRIGRRYVAMFNARHGRSGTLWQGRFRATVIEPERYLLTALRLVESGPVREQLVMQARDWAWSSAPHHVGRLVDGLVAEHPLFWSLGNTPFERQARYGALLDADDHGEHEVLRQAAVKGWVAGGADFVARVSEGTDRPLAPRPRGRPRKVHAGTPVDGGPTAARPFTVSPNK